MPQAPELNSAASAEIILGQNRDILGIPLGKVKEIKTAKPDNLRGVSVPDASGDSWKEPRDTVHAKVMYALDPSNPDHEKVLAEVAKTLKSPEDVKKLYEQYLINKSSPGYSPAEVALLEATTRVAATHESNGFIADACLSLEKEATEWVAERKSSLVEQRQTQEGLKDRYVKDLDALRSEVDQLEIAVKQLEEGYSVRAQKDIGVMKEKLSPHSDLMEEFVHAVRKGHEKEIGFITKKRQRFGKPEYSFDGDEVRYISRQISGNQNFLLETLTDAERNTLDVNPLHKQAVGEAASLATDQSILNYVGKNLGTILQIGGDSIFPKPVASDNALDAIPQDGQNAVTRMAVSVLILHPEIPIRDDNIRTVIETARKRVSESLVTARVDEIKRTDHKYQDSNGVLATQGKERDITSHNLQEAEQLLRRNAEEVKNLEGPGKIINHVQDGLGSLAKSLGVLEREAYPGEQAISKQIASVSSSLILARLANDALFYDNEQLANYAQRRTARFGEIRKALHDKLLSPTQADPKTREDLQRLFSAYDETILRAENFVDKRRWEETQGEVMKSILQGANLTSSAIEDRTSVMESLAKVAGDSSQIVEVKACPTQIPPKDYAGDLPRPIWIQKVGDKFVVTSYDKPYSGNPYYFHFDIDNDSFGCRVGNNLLDHGTDRTDDLPPSNNDLFKNLVGMNSESIIFIKPTL